MLKQSPRKQYHPATPLLQENGVVDEPLTSVNIVVERVPSGEEKWTNTGNTPAPKFTIADAQKMEWNYANVPMSRRKSSNGLLEEFEQLDMLDNEDLTVLLDPFYDVTTGRLKRMFRHFAPNGEEKVSYEDFYQGLLVLGITLPDDEPIDVFIRKIDTDQDGMINLDEFIHVVQLIKQAHLFKPDLDIETYQDSILRVVDYSPISIHTVSPVKMIHNFMFSSKPTWAKVRWIHLAGFHRGDDINLRRLAIKYQLHPLALEDCLNMDDDIRCKYELYEDHSFLCLPVIRPFDKEKLQDIERYIRQHRYDMYKKDRNLVRDRSMSITSIMRLRTPHEKATEYAAKLDNLQLLMRKPQQLCIFVHKDDNVLSIQEETDMDDSSGFPLWQLVFNNQMGKSYSKLRNHDASFLVITILNAIIDDMRPLVNVSEVQLTIIGKLLRLQKTKFNTKRFQRTKKNLVALEKIVRPLMDLVDGQLMEQDEFNKGEVKNYLRDARDHLKQMTNCLKESHQELMNLIDEEKQIRTQHKDDVLYIMSISATLFLPGTFMTGLYGMNFDNMPELHSEYGYGIWWIAFLSVVLTLFTYLRCIKKWI